MNLSESASYDAGYEQALDDIAQAILRDGERGALQWLELHLGNTPTRILIIARLVRAAHPDGWY